MKVIGFSLVLLVSAALGDDAPYPASGWKPNGALLLLPKYGPPANETTPAPAQDEQDLEKVNESVMERLRQEQGSNRGVYYVYLPDGRLQRVQYTTAPLKQAPHTQQSSFQTTQQNTQIVFGSHQINSQGNSQRGKYQDEYTPLSPYQTPFEQKKIEQGNPSDLFAQYKQVPAQNQPIYYSQYKEQKVEPGNPSHLFAQYQEQEKTARLEQENQPKPSYVASVQFTNVDPIEGPVYSYEKAPLVRVVRYAPMFQ